MKYIDRRLRIIDDDDQTTLQYVSRDKEDVISLVFGNGALTLTGATFSAAGTDITGNAATATRLYTAKTINGVAFDGSTNISVPSNIAPGTSGNVLTSNGTVWTSATPAPTSPTYLYFAGGNIRIGERGTNFVIDRVIGGTGFAGTEDVDWENIGGAGV